MIGDCKMDLIKETYTEGYYNTEVTLSPDYTVKRTAFGRLKLMYSRAVDVVNWNVGRILIADFGEFNIRTTRSIDSTGSGWNIVAISDEPKTFKQVLTHYGLRNEGSEDKPVYKSYVVGTISSDYVIQRILENQQHLPNVYKTYSGDEDEKICILYVADKNAACKYEFDRVEKGGDLVPKGSVLVQKSFVQEDMAKVRDLLTFGFNPVSGEVTTNVYSELQDKIISLEHLKEVASEKSITTLNALYMEVNEYIKKELATKPGMYAIAGRLLQESKVR